MNEADKRVVRKELYLNHVNGCINRATLVENGLTLAEVIDRDIQTLSEHKLFLQKKIDFCKGSYVRSFVPFMNKFAVMISGGVSAFTGLFAIGGSEWCKRIYNGGDVSTRWYNWGIDRFADWGVFPQSDYEKEVAQRLALMNKQNPGFFEVGVAVPVAAVISTVSGLLFIKCFYDTCRHQGKVNAYIQKVQKRFERDQAIIVQLEEIKQTV